MHVAPAVAAALEERQPVVALESTIIAHGFPQGRNLDVAKALESAVVDGGALPATIAVLDGEIVVGLDSDQLAHVATASMEKVNVATLAACIGERGDGATTVSATLRIARMAGIAVMATGGIGGVHRGAGTDVSSDITEIAGGDVAVVSAGAKAFLDLAATLERLETSGVSVVGYGTDTFPAFYATSSGLPLHHRVDSPAAAAAIIRAAFEVGAGVLITNPIADGLSLSDVEQWTAQALQKADAAGIEGPERSPFVLTALADVSEGRVIEANAALAEANAALAARIAVEL